MQCPAEATGWVELIVRLLGGRVVATLRIEGSLSIELLRMEVEKETGAPALTLTWGSTILYGARTLSELGMSGQEELTAICGRTIEGEFEHFEILGDCQCCDWEIRHVRAIFGMDGRLVVWNNVYTSEPVSFRYSLGLLQHGSMGFWRGMELVEAPPAEGEDDEFACSLCAAPLDLGPPSRGGELFLDANDPIARKVHFTALSLQSRLLEDARSLRRRGMNGEATAELQLRCMILYSELRDQGLVETAEDLEMEVVPRRLLEPPDDEAAFWKSRRKSAQGSRRPRRARSPRGGPRLGREAVGAALEAWAARRARAAEDRRRKMERALRFVCA